MKPKGRSLPPATKLRQGNVLHVSVILFTGGRGVSVRETPGQRPPWTETSLDRDPLGRDPLGRDPPGQRPPGLRPPDRNPPGQRPPWNAFLLIFIFKYTHSRWSGHLLVTSIFTVHVRSLREGNVFSYVCLSFCLSMGGGVPI